MGRLRCCTLVPPSVTTASTKPDPLVAASVNRRHV